MTQSLAQFGYTVTAGAEGELELRGPACDWLRLALRTFGLRARIDGDVLHVSAAERPAVERICRTAFAPAAMLFDLDGVLADLARGTALATPVALGQIAARWPVAVVTTCPRRLAESVLHTHGFASLVQTVVGSDDGPPKPDPFPVTEALARLGVDGAWMLGDNPSDMTAARGGGALPFAIAPHGIGASSHAGRLRAAGALQLVPDVAAFARLVDERVRG